MSWKEPCQSYAHSPLFAENSRVIPIDRGRNIIVLVYSMTGMSSTRKRIKYYKARLNRAIRLLRIV